MDFINSLISNSNIPAITAFLLGILISISPCHLATNLTAIAFISKDIKKPGYVILSGLFYTLGRGISYTILSILIYIGISSYNISNIFQGWGDKILGPIMIIIGLIMLNVIKISFVKNDARIERIKLWLSNKGYLGSMVLGMLFALAFCPYSGILFFSVLIPLIISSRGGLMLALIFSLGTGLPVILFSALLAFSMKTINKTFDIVKNIEKWMRCGVSIVFILVGIYYCQYLIIYLINL
jgi:cytochrome c-type biogenesis protein